VAVERYIYIFTKILFFLAHFSMSPLFPKFNWGNPLDEYYEEEYEEDCK
jgi:hypothetical protein